MRSWKTKLIMPAMAAAVGLTLLAPKPANAFFIVALPTSAVTNNYYGLDVNAMTPGQGVLCVIFLPICVLDEKGTPQGTVNQQELIENGYTAPQAASLISQTQQLGQILDSTHQRLQISPTDSAATVANGVRAVMPNATFEFAQYLKDRAN